MLTERNSKQSNPGLVPRKHRYSELKYSLPHKRYTMEDQARCWSSTNESKTTHKPHTRGHGVEQLAHTSTAHFHPERERRAHLQKARSARSWNRKRPRLSSWPLIWLREKDLNLRPLGYEPNELPDCSIARQSMIIAD